MFSFGDEFEWQQLQNGRYQELLTEMRKNAATGESRKRLQERQDSFEHEDRLVAWQRIAKTTH